jgi:hypothetical protein
LLPQKHQYAKDQYHEAKSLAQPALRDFHHQSGPDDSSQNATASELSYHYPVDLAANDIEYSSAEGDCNNDGQRAAMGNMLWHSEAPAQQRNNDHPTADAEETG